MTAFSEFLAYKTRVPVRGAIMLNDTMDSVVLVKGWKKGANWSFPRGKINKDEKDLDCAIREVYEETGFDIRASDVFVDEDNTKYIEVSMREQHMRLYVFRGVPMDTHFEPRTRKEISVRFFFFLNVNEKNGDANVIRKYNGTIFPSFRHLKRISINKVKVMKSLHQTRTSFTWLHHFLYLSRNGLLSRGSLTKLDYQIHQLRLLMPRSWLRKKKPPMQKMWP
jgi:8-oxo-dGTP pyrophosphatase MutT (NUDIX family)